MLDFIKVNSVIEVEIGMNSTNPKGSNVYRTRVEDVQKDGFLIGIPIDKGVLVPVHTGSEIIVWHWDNSASYAHYCKVIGRKHEPIPLLFLSWPYDVKKIQRRNFVRIPINITLEHRLLSNEKEEEKKFQKSLTRDLSGGGAQFISKENYKKGDKLEVIIHLDDNKIVTKALVKRVYNEYINGIDRILVGIEFLNIPEKSRDTIIRFVFSKQRELIKKGVL